MAKFNKPAPTTTPKKTVNHMGAPAFEYNAKTDLVGILLTSFVEDSYYAKKGDFVKRLIELLDKVDPLFAAKAAIYARNVFNMRSITHILASEVAKYASGKEWNTAFYEEVVSRPDDILEILSYHFAKGDKLSKGMQKGMANALNKFDAYQLAKYKGENRDIKLVDAVNILHPTPSPQKELVEVSREDFWNAMSEKTRKKKGFTSINKLPETVTITPIDALMLGLLKSAETWEAKLSKAGQVAKSKEEKLDLKKEAWIELIASKRIGYFALLRNLRNILEQAPEALDDALALLTNEKMVRNSKVFPFHFLSAYEQIKALAPTKSYGYFEKTTQSILPVDKVLKAIDEATKLSVANIPTFMGTTLILSDNSGSMTGDRGGSSRMSTMTTRKTSDIANLFAVLCWLRSDNTRVGLFGDRLVTPKLDRSRGVYYNFEIIDKAKDTVGGGTETGIFHQFEELLAKKIKVDRVVVFSDCQIGKGCLWYDTTGRRGSSFNDLFERYRKEVNPDVTIYSIDLKNYGSTVFDKNTIKLFGFSEKIFELMGTLERDRNALVKEIEKIEFGNSVRKVVKQ